MKFFCIFATVLIFISCEMDLTDFVKFPEKLSDQKFNGKFSHDMSSVVYGRGSRTYKFDGTNLAVLESSQSYASGYQRSHLDYEIEISNGRYRERLWDNEYSSWSKWEDYHFDDEGDLWIGILEYEKEN
jgi:hypothetical protein